MYPPSINQTNALTALCATQNQELKNFTEDLLENLGEIKVLKNRTGLIMLPYRDTAQGQLFHLGEVLISEAHVKLEQFNTEGYAACLGRDLEQALAIAILDASLSAQIQLEKIEPFIAKQIQKQSQADETLLKQVEATRVEMETF